MANITINKLISNYNHYEGRSGNSIEYIVIHYVGALGGAKANCQYYAGGDRSASAHYYVGFDGEIWQSVEDANAAWHCGGGLQGSGGASFYKKCTNYNSIGIEMCVRKKSTATMNATDKDWYFEDATVTSAVELTKYLMKKYGVSADHVIRHYDITGKICPNPYVYNTGSHTWDEFKSLISGSSSSGSTTDSSTETSDGSELTEKWYRVRKSWDDAKSQTGAYKSLENAKKDCAYGYTVYDWNGQAVYTPEAPSVDTMTAKDLSGTEAEKIAMIAPIYQACMAETGMLASVGLAQFCLESGYGTTDLAQNANNMHGMKCSLSGNTWSGSTWDGSSKYTKKTAEQDANGNEYYVTADFRSYPCIKDSVLDRAAYFIGAKNGSNLRYPGIAQITNAEEQIKAIKAGGYATDVNYVSKLMKLVNQYDLTQYDNVEVTGSTDTDSNSTITTETEEKTDTSDQKTEATSTSAVMTYIVQAGAYTDKENADARVKSLKKAGFDSFVKQEDGMCKVQAGSFSIKKNAENLVAKLKKKGFSAFVKEVSSSDSDDSNDTSTEEKPPGEKVVEKAQEIADYMMSNGFVYTYNGKARLWENAKTLKVATCVLFTGWVFQELGYLKQKEIVNCKSNGKVVYDSDYIKTTCTVTEYKSGKLVTDLDLQAGDMVCFNGHVNIYCGKNAKGKRTWLDAGRGATKDCCTGSPFAKMNMTGDYTQYKVYAVIRPK